MIVWTWIIFVDIWINPPSGCRCVYELNHAYGVSDDFEFYGNRDPRGFGFIQYVDPDDAADAKYHMDGQILLGRELTVVFAEENRKKPAEMRARERRR